MSGCLFNRPIKTLPRILGFGVMCGAAGTLYRGANGVYLCQKPDRKTFVGFKSEAELITFINSNLPWTGHDEDPRKCVA